MSQMKKWQQNIHLATHVTVQKSFLKNKKPNSCLENLSNGIFSEIFDYLDGCDIYRSFSGLNTRFEHLLINKSLLLKINFHNQSESILQYYYKKYIYPNKHQIISLHFHKKVFHRYFFNLCTLNPSFNHLQSIILHDISPCKLVLLLCNFKSLPQLFALTIYTDHPDEDLTGIYLMIFHLRYLKHLKLKITSYQTFNLRIPIATKQDYLSIEYLSIHHYLSYNSLATLFSYTPRLTHFYCYSISNTIIKFQFENLPKFKNLTHFTLSVYYLIFDQFEEFLRKISSQLKFLNIKIQYIDKNYLDADRWERLIVQHMPCLIIFDFSYYDSIIDDIKITQHHTLINRFTSSFWIKHQWFFDFTLETDEMLYRIRPYAKHLYDFHELKYYDQNSLIHYNPGVHMSIAKIGRPRSRPNEPYQIFIDKISPLFQMIDVTHLFINCDQMNYNVLIHILNLLPNLDLLRIRLPSSSSSEEFFVSGEDNKNLRRFLDNNKITRLILGNIYELEKISFIFNLFPRLKYFAMEIINILDLESIVECTIRKIKENNNHHHPMTLCIIIYEEIHDELKKIQQIIDSNNLLKDYTINRRTNKFYIQWK